MHKIGVGIVGFGTVGAGVAEGLQRNRDKLAERSGIDVELRRIVDLDITTDRGVAVEASILSTGLGDVVGNPEVDIVVELIGGTGIARTVIREALEAGQSVVTANKKLLAEHGAELFRLAESKGVDIYFGASVGGGIPIVRIIREALAGNEIESVFGILNGTCNYILTRMESEGLSFDDALAAAQREGFAEADPSLDVDGLDTLHKTAILAALSYGFTPEVETLSVQGIRGIEAADIRYAAELGFRIKLLGIIRNVEGEVELRVAPTLVERDGMLGSVSGVYNAALVRSDLAGSTLYYGRGAGRLPTASTVIGDIADVAFNRVHDAPLRVIMPTSRTPVRLKSAEDIRCRHYLRVGLKDCAGTMGKVASVLASKGVSIASILQKSRTHAPDSFVPVIILTHVARRGDVDAALAEISTLDIVSGTPVCFGIE